MPILTVQLEKEKEKSKSKFWNIPGLSGTDELKSPTTASSGWFSRKEVKDREAMSRSVSGIKPVSAGGSVGRSGNPLLKGGLLRKKDSGERERERERGKANANEGDSNRGPRPQLWVATSSAASSSTAAADSSKSLEQVRSPTFVPGRLVRRMQSDASILSLRAGDTGPESSSPQKKKKRTVVKLLDSSIDFIDGM
jgi:hypothetical protein